MERNFVTVDVTINKLLDDKKYKTLRDILTTMNAYDIAEMFADFHDSKIQILFRMLPKELAADVFVEMDEDTQEFLIKGFSDSELKEVVDELSADDAVDIIEEMPANVVKRILRQADAETRKQINELLKYPDDSAGSIMTTEFVNLRPSMTVDQAILRIRRTGVDKETIYTCYVTRDDSTLAGVITIKDILLADEDDIIENLMEENVISVGTLDDQEQVAQIVRNYDFMAVPVVDTENRLVGIVTFDDAVDVMEEETTEDIQKMAAITSSDKPYTKIGVFETWWHRFPWLLLLMISATFTGIIISSFEDKLAASLVLTAYIPMLMGTAGNAGSQSSVTVIRALSLEEIEFKDLLWVIFKECRVSIICGVTLAVVNFGKMLLVDQMLLHNPDVTPTVALVVSLTILIVVVVAKIVGCSLPMVAKKIGVDPAVMASPFITTIVDTVSLLVFFAIATQILNI
ncbi:MAG: magnesium transporter [Ruminococcus sp.]|nr:magnesium transporter [Ruminococcus sp.]MDO4419139.1 magnesium transporter [Ruminococcus sp.]